MSNVTHGVYSGLLSRNPDSMELAARSIIDTCKEDMVHVLKTIEHDMNIQKLDDWYRVRRKDVTKYGTSMATKRYRGTLVEYLRKLYPDHAWEEWRFDAVPSGFWTDLTNKRRYLNYVASKINVNTMEDWYRVTVSDITPFGGRSLLHYYNDSLIKCLRDAFPEHLWQFWRFKSLPKGTWADEANRREYVDWLSEKLHIMKKEDWYSITRQQMKLLGGETLLVNFFGGSIPNFLSAMYPEHAWQPWRFVSGPPKYYWESVENQKKFLQWAANELKIESVHDWRSVSKVRLVGMGGLFLYHKQNESSMQAVLQSLFGDTRNFPTHQPQ